MVRLLATPMVFVWLLILVAVEQIYDQITRRLVAQKVAPGARVILSQTPSFRRWRLWMETMAYCGSRYRCRCHDAVICLYSRARSLRNLLVSGNECGRVFPAGVGPGSPSRDAANWLPSRFSLSVETRRRYGWLRMMVFPGARLFPSPNLVPFGRVAARERQGALSRRAW